MGKKAQKNINKFYAVKKGLKPGIYKTWNECKIQVYKFPGAIYKSFKTLSEAEEFMEIKSKKDNIIKSEAFAYIDGSFNKFKKIYGYGGFINYKGEKYIIQGKGDDPNLVEMRNVAGEIIASQEIIKKAIELGIKNLDIYYDYEGIERWAKGEWNRNKPGTINYYEFFQKIKSEIKINFCKVKGHSGEKGNDEADKLAKEACFNEN